MSTDTERKKKSSYRRGNVVSPEPASDQSAMKNVFDFLQDYVPQAVSGPKKEEHRERVLWASFEYGDLNDLSMNHLGPSSSPAGSHTHLPLLLTLGFANGFSLWMINSGGDAKELYAVYGEGETARTVRLLKTPEICEGVAPDKFTDQRPIIATVKKGRHSQTGSTVAYSTMQLVSLRSLGNGDSVVRKFVFKSRAIATVECNRRVIAVVFQKRVVVLDAGSFENKFVIRNNYPSIGYPCNPIALGQRWIAFSETKLTSKHQSIGGMSNTTPPSMATTVLKNVKKGISALTETISGLAGKAQQGSETIEPLPQVTDTTSANVVSILDTCRTYPQEVKLHDLERQSGVIAHFLAHTGANVHVAALAFNPSGNLLVTASTEGHNFHVFNILPHPWFSSETAVHHLYTLFRGATSGMVQDISIANDSRWVAVSTLNGTSHIFPITPYGGDITVRTHTSKRVVNKMSRFHTTAGMESFSHSHSQSQNLHNSNTLLSHAQSSAAASSSPPRMDPREFPTSSTSPGMGVVNSVTGSNGWNNPRSLPLPSPVCVTALQQVKQPYLTNSEAAGSGGVVGGSLTSPRKGGGASFEGGEPFVTLNGPDSICVKATFATHGYNQAQNWGRSDSPEKTASYSLYVVGSNGVLTEHVLQPQKLSSAADGEDAPIELARFPKMAWRLMGIALSGSIPLPLAEDNPLILANNDYKQFLKRSKEDISVVPSSEKSDWLSQVEILTYAPPSRRLWMGPQFSFKAYTSSSVNSPSNDPSSISSSANALSSATILHTPSPPNTVIYSSSLNSPTSVSSHHLPHSSFKMGVQSSLSHGSLDNGSGRQGSVVTRVEGSDDVPLQSAVLFPSPENPLLDLLSDPPEIQNLTLASIHSDALSMPTSQYTGREGTSESGSVDPGVVEVYGSWKKVAPRLESSVFETEVEKQLEEAMIEQDSQSITVVASGGNSTKTGFYPLDES